MRYLNTPILDAPDTATINGSQIDSDALVYASFQIVFGDATAAGALKIQASNDVCPQGHLPSSFVVTNWSDVPNATATATVGGVLLIPKLDLTYRWIRAVYTRASGGSTTIAVNMMAFSA